MTGIPPQQQPPVSRSLEDIDADLRAYTIRELRQREILLGALEDLDAIARRRDVLLEQRHTAARAGA